MQEFSRGLIIITVLSMGIMSYFSNRQENIVHMPDYKIVILIRECEKTIPRDKECKLIAVINEAPDG